MQLRPPLWYKWCVDFQTVWQTAFGLVVLIALLGVLVFGVGGLISEMLEHRRANRPAPPAS